MGRAGGRAAMNNPGILNDDNAEKMHRRSFGEIFRYEVH